MISVSLKSLLLKFKSITSLFQNELLIITFRAQDFVRTDANYREDHCTYSFFVALKFHLAVSSYTFSISGSFRSASVSERYQKS